MDSFKSYLNGPKFFIFFYKQINWKIHKKMEIKIKRIIRTRFWKTHKPLSLHFCLSWNLMYNNYIMKILSQSPPKALKVSRPNAIKFLPQNFFLLSVFLLRSSGKKEGGGGKFVGKTRTKQDQNKKLFRQWESVLFVYIPSICFGAITRLIWNILISF